MVVATCFVSNITSTLSALWALKRYENTQALLLKRYLVQNRVSVALGARVLKHVDCVLELRQRKVDPGKVNYLGLLSGPLNMDLQYELWQPHLSGHPLFSQYQLISKRAMKEICVSALTENRYPKGDVVFLRGAASNHMYFLSFGVFVYRVKRLDPCTEKRVKLEKDKWCCECPLWIHWRHRGIMKAITAGDICMLSASKFAEITASHAELGPSVAEYFEDFLEHAQLAASFGVHTVTDIFPDIMPLGKLGGRSMSKTASRAEKELVDSEADAMHDVDFSSDEHHSDDEDE